MKITAEEFETDPPGDGQCPCWTIDDLPQLGIRRRRFWFTKPSGEAICIDCGKPKQVVSIRQPRP